MTLVSVIIPNYSHAIYLRKRIESVLEQEYEDFEVIILDDCSKDDSRSIIESYKSHPKVSQIIFNDVNTGSPFKQWMKGLELAKGDWIWIAESDDYAEKSFLKEVSSCFNLNSDIGLIYTNSYLIDKNNIVWSQLSKASGQSLTYNGKDFASSMIRSKSMIRNASSAVFKKNLVSLSLKDAVTKFSYTGDWFFWQNISVNTMVCFIDKHLNFFRENSSNNIIETKVTSKKEPLGIAYYEAFMAFDYAIARGWTTQENIRNTSWHWMKRLANCNSDPNTTAYIKKEIRTDIIDKFSQINPYCQQYYNVIMLLFSPKRLIRSMLPPTVINQIRNYLY
jgi:glycosyltransferase involved in cell wall biosynthesis